MEAALRNDIFLDNYLGLLNGLSKESKIKLVERLDYDIKHTPVAEPEWINRLYGSFISDKSAEEIIAEIRAARRSSREIPEF